jgi:hypothetical protein
VGFVVDKVALGRVFSEYFGFLANHHSTKFSILIITRGRYNKANWWPTCRVDPVGQLKKTVLSLQAIQPSDARNY